MKHFLIVVDMQKDFVDGALGTSEAQLIVDNVVSKINSFEGEIFATLDTHYDDYMETAEGRKLPVKHCIKGTDGWQLDKKVANALVEKGYTGVEKNTFGSTELPMLIEEAAGDEDFDIELVGLCTDICVVSNALLLKAYYSEMDIRVDAACCAGVSVNAHRAALDTMRSCQIDVINEQLSEFDAVKVKDECVAWVRQFFEENGPDCKAVLGISGGKDSSVAAAICVEALGKDRVVGVLMPNGEQSDIDASYMLVKHLDIEHHVINIKDAYDGVMAAMPKDLKITEQTKINLAPRLRMSVVYAVSQSVNGRVVNTCNMSEDWVGYSTRYGDAAGDFSPLMNLTVAEVKEIGRVLGLPCELVDKAPSDGLSGKTDEDNLGFTYAELDRYIRTGKIDNKEHKELIDRKHKLNLFKLAPMPGFKPQGLKAAIE